MSFDDNSGGATTPLQLALAWGFVGIPLLWGIYGTLVNAMKLRPVGKFAGRRTGQAPFPAGRPAAWARNRRRKRSIPTTNWPARAASPPAQGAPDPRVRPKIFRIKSMADHSAVR